MDCVDWPSALPAGGAVVAIVVTHHSRLLTCSCHLGAFGRCRGYSESRIMSRCAVAMAVNLSGLPERSLSSVRSLAGAVDREIFPIFAAPVFDARVNTGQDGARIWWSACWSARR